MSSDHLRLISWNVAGKAWAWNTGWMYLCAQVITVPAVALAWQVILPQISSRFQLVGSSANSANYFSKDFAENAVVLAIIMVGLTTIINVAGVSVMARINNIGVIAELIGASGLIILFLIHVNRGPQHVLNRLVHCRHRRVAQLVGRVCGRVASGQQQHIALAQRHIELLSEAEDHLACGPGSPSFDERQMPGRYLGPQREVELGEPAPLPPASQQLADRMRLLGGGQDSCRGGHLGHCRPGQERRRLPAR